MRSDVHNEMKTKKKTKKSMIILAGKDVFPLDQNFQWLALSKLARNR